jgi:large subunit ribosomal protein L15
MADLPEIIIKRPKRLGRGYGSGKGGHTVGRGQKGQKARGSIAITFTGTKVKKSLIKRLPFRRGRGKFSAGKKPVIIKLAALNLLPAGSKVDLNLLVKERIVDADDARSFGVKILGDGDLEKKMTIELPISKSAARKVEEVGGEVIS